MLLVGNTDKRQHNNYDIDYLDRYTYEAFKGFVRDYVRDPVNRILSITINYKAICQKESQSAQNFALELATLEDQLRDYTKAQKIRYLLAKLLPTLRSTIVKYYAVPTTRQELVTLATRIETLDKGARRMRKEDRRDDRRQFPSSLSQKKPRFKRSNKQRSSKLSLSEKALESISGTLLDQKSRVKCYSYYRKGYSKSDCPNRHLQTNNANITVRKINASEAKEQGKGRVPTKS